MIIVTGHSTPFEMDYYRHSFGNMYLIFFPIELDFKACLNKATLFGCPSRMLAACRGRTKPTYSRPGIPGNSSVVTHVEREHGIHVRRIRARMRTTLTVHSPISVEVGALTIFIRIIGVVTHGQSGGFRPYYVDTVTQRPPD